MAKLLPKCQAFLASFYLAMKYNRLLRVAVCLLLLLTYCEWLHYYVVLLRCTWPRLQGTNQAGWTLPVTDLKVMFLADTHILGNKEGHWFDRLRREWQMQRAFQTSMFLHQPDLVFVLGDLLDEGKWCEDEEFAYHVQRFNTMFNVPAGTQRHVVVGNHDVGFHYMMTPHKSQRFSEAFQSPSVGMLHVNGVNFIFLNSMAMEGDGCNICSEATRTLNKISQQLKCAKEGFKSTGCDQHESFLYSRPILLQHFPMYRPSDVNCSTVDAAPPQEKKVPFKPKQDTLSERATAELFKLLDPRLVIGAHIHHGCFRIHDNGVPEWTVASFSWRNKQNPSFLMSRISSEGHKVHLCQMPDERTVLLIYIVGVLSVLVNLCLSFKASKLRKTS